MPSEAKKCCFVIMPFKDELKDVYWKAIRPAAIAAGYDCLRVDELKGTFNIHRKIIQNIFESEVIIADLTHWNPNVFYEMGVAHAIDNKTLMIVQKKEEKLPFDISTYRVIQYEPTAQGLKDLCFHIKDNLETFHVWCTEPTNPVQDFKPNDAYVPHNKFKRLQSQLQAKEKLLQKMVSAEIFHEKLQTIERLTTDLNELEAKQGGLHLQNQELTKQAAEWPQIKTNFEKQIAELKKDIQNLTQENQKLSKTLSQQKATGQENSRWIQEKAGYEQKIAELQEKIQKLSPQEAKLQAESPKKKSVSVIKPLFRSNSETLSRDDVVKMLKEKDFFDSSKNENGHGFENKLEEKNLKGEKVIIDHAAGLMWQKGGSDKYMPFNDTGGYIKKLNADKFAGFSDWRLPTLEEAMSLMEPKKNRAGLYIDNRFDAKQSHIWTADQVAGGSLRWVVDFINGHCNDYDIYFNDYLRLVRSGLSSTGE